VNFTEKSGMLVEQETRSMKRRCGEGLDNLGIQYKLVEYEVDESDLMPSAWPGK